MKFVDSSEKIVTFKDQATANACEYHFYDFLNDPSKTLFHLDSPGDY